VSLAVYRLDKFNKKIMDRLTFLEKTAFGEGGMNQWQLAPLVRYGKVFCLEYAGEIIGVLQFMRLWEGQVCYLVGITVEPDHRFNGYGKFFLQEALGQIRRDGFRQVLLTVALDNKQAIEIYTDLGFREAGFLKEEYGPGEDRLLMVLEVDED
jgi:ribosomal-protein-alanine N-acetyltransferase